MTNFMFQVGERVVHPQHGVGEIIKLENREFEHGKPHTYYEVAIPNDGRVWVPVDLPNSGLRYLATKREIAECRKILAAKPKPVTEDGRVRQSELVARIKQGSIATQCEVVRDLSAFVAHKPAYGTIPPFLEAIHGVLIQEWAIVEGIPIYDATNEISFLLKKSVVTVAGK
jgi:CarD family transcriptional regulator, regulator of rRNA transcription